MVTDLFAPWHGTPNGYDGYSCRCYACSDAKYAVNRRRYREFRAWLDDVKRRPCMDCGMDYPTACMEFDYRDPAGKSFSIATGAMRSRAAVVAEIAKCDIVCANCRRLRSARRRG